MARYDRRLVCVGLSLLLGCADGAHEAMHEAPSPSARLQVALDAERVQLRAGEQLALHATISGEAEGDGAVTWRALGLPAGATFDADALVLHARADAPHSLPSAVTLIAEVGDRSAQAALVLTLIGAPGERDTSFTESAVHSSGASDEYARAVAVQDDGKIVVLGRSATNQGDITLVRLERDGALDPTFGDDGRVTTDIAGRDDAPYAIALDPHGRILVAGSTQTDAGLDFLLLRYDTRGARDEHFGTAGHVTTAFTRDADVAFAILLQTDGKIVLGGHANLGSGATGLDFALARYDDGGALDPSFGEGGVLTTSLADGGARDSVYALVEQRIAGVPYIVAAGGEGDFTAARYTADGALDTRFADGGRLVGVFGSTIGAARSVAVTSAGAIVLAGHRGHDFALARLTPGGELDAEFGEGGVRVTPVSATNWDEVEAMALADDGAIVVAGFCYSGDSSSGDFALARYSPEGALDRTFGQAGLVIEALAGARADEAHGLALQHDARIPATRAVVVGHASVSFAGLATARFWL